MDWQPIETAPKDGQDILLFVQPSREQFIAYWHKRFSRWCFGESLTGLRLFTKGETHWMPLPSAPDEPELLGDA